MDYNKYILNGRVNLFDTNNPSFKIDNSSLNLYTEKTANTVNRLYSGNCLSEMYFSKENINIVQQGIINSVYNKSEGKYSIGKQSEQELAIIMRSIYLQYSKNLNFNIQEQILDLNTRVIRWCVDEIITNIKQYVDYRKNVSTMPMPLEHAQLPSQKGTKTLEIKSFI